MNNKQKHICFWANSMFKLGGEQRVTTQIANALVRQGYQVTIIIKHNEPVNYGLLGLSTQVNILFNKNFGYDFRLNCTKRMEKLRTLNRKTGLFYHFPKLIKRFFCSQKLEQNLISIINNNNFDFVVGVAGDRSFILASIAHKIKPKIIAWQHMNFDAHFVAPHTRYTKEQKFIAPLLHKFEHIVVLAQHDVTLFAKHYGVKATFIANPKSFLCNECAPLTSKQIVSIGRFEKVKNFNLLIEAFALFFQTHPDFYLKIYGSGPLEHALQSQIDALNLGNAICLNKPTSSVKEALLNSAFFALASKSEGFGMVVIEALECGVPIVAFDVLNTNQVIKHNYNGLLAVPFCVQDFANKMAELADDAQLRNKLAQNTKASIANCEIDAVICHWNNLFNS